MLGQQLLKMGVLKKFFHKLFFYKDLDVYGEVVCIVDKRVMGL